MNKQEAIKYLRKESEYKTNIKLQELNQLLDNKNNNINNFTLYNKSLNLYCKASTYISKFGIHYRNTLGTSIENIILNTIDLVIEFEYSKDKYNKLSILEMIDKNKLLLSTRINLSYMKSLLSIKQYKSLMISLSEIGKIVGGLIKSLTNKENDIKFNTILNQY